MLTTKRLILRPWLESDAEDLYFYAKDSKIGPPAGWPPHKSAEESLEIIKTVFAHPETYAVCLKEDNRAIGCIGYQFGENSELNLPEKEGEIGFWIGVPFWGRGYIPEALEEILRHGFEDLNLEKAWCVYTEAEGVLNEKSKRVQEKAGFVFKYKEENKKDELMHDIRNFYVNCMTKDEWKNRKNQ